MATRPESEPFEAITFERAWGAEAVSVAVRQLGAALTTLAPCSALYEWTASHAELAPPCEEGYPDEASAEAAVAAARVLAEHALLREQVAAVERYASVLPLAERLAFLAAASFVEGDVPRAQQLLDQSLAFASRGGARSGVRIANGALPGSVAVTPLLALLLESRRTEAASELAKQLMGSPVARAGFPGAARAFRLLLRQRAASDAPPSRLHAHRVADGAHAWEVVLLGLTAYGHQTHEWTRAAWTKLLVTRGVAWLEADYAWMGRQALCLAQGLNPAQFHKEWEPERKRLKLAPLRPPVEGHADGLLFDLARPKPDWELTLEALSQVASNQEQQPEHTRRIEWFVNMADGSLSRPGLAEFRAGAWTAAQRVDVGEAYRALGELPAEDARVLSCSVETDGKRELPPEALEALIGHPRVFNGARGKLPISVVRGECRVETLEEGGMLTLFTVPRQAELGVNVVVEAENRISVYRVSKAMQRVFALIPRGLRVPRDRQAEAFAVLEKLSSAVEVRSAHLGAEVHTPANSTPCLRVTPVAGAWLVQLGVRPFGPKGRFFVAGEGPALLSQWAGGERLRTERSFEQERARASALIAGCPTLLGASLDADQTPSNARGGWTFGHDALLTLLSELRELHAPCEFDWATQTPFSLRGSVSSKSLHGSLRRAKGWYLATGGVRIDDVTELTLGEFASLPTYVRGRFVQLPSGDYLEVEKRVRRVMAALAAAQPVGRPASGLRLHESSLHALRDVAGPGGGLELDASVSEWLARFDRVRTAPYEPPSELCATLRPYQLEGYRWLSALSELSLGACLADDMGLGKTVQILALLLARAGRGPALVVAPTSVCTNWMREIERFAPTLRAHEYLGQGRGALLDDLRAKDGKHPILVCSYTVLQQDAVELGAVDWDTVALDEAQLIKNPQALRAKAAHALKASFRVAATGTPVENHLGDLWSIFHFLNPALVGSWPAFQRTFVQPVERDGNLERQEALRKLVEPYVLRRMKADVLSELPPVTTILHEVRLSAEEGTRYALLRRQIHEKLRTPHGRRQYKLEIFSEITRLRRFCCHPRLVFPEASSEATKLDVFLDLALELMASGHRALVFSQFVDFLTIVRERLEELGIAYEYLDGSTPKTERQKRVDAFQEGRAPLFLMSLKAGGMGLNLTAADYVIHLDPWWNPAVEAQATDRAHRIGQTRPVNVYRLITKDSIEESIVALHERKKGLADALLAGGDKAAALGVDELLALIGEPFTGEG